MSQIRLSRTAEIDEVLSYLRERYPLLSEAEIIKMVLSEKYRETQIAENIINFPPFAYFGNLFEDLEV
jgi:hypothetical protein